jgi:hypothetical protein
MIESCEFEVVIDVFDVEVVVVKDVVKYVFDVEVVVDKDVVHVV